MEIIDPYSFLRLLFTEHLLVYSQTTITVSDLTNSITYSSGKFVTLKIMNKGDFLYFNDKFFHKAELKMHFNSSISKFSDLPIPK
jgi:hypothetical protein